MAYDGFVVAGFEGPADRGGLLNLLAPPPIVAGLRPDAWGYDPARPWIAVAEAKTADDIDTEHTRAQLRAFSSLRSRADGTQAKLYVAVPRSAARALDRVLADIGLAEPAGLVRVHVPDIFLTAVA
jgi:hypothetical protein